MFFNNLKAVFFTAMALCLLGPSIASADTINVNFENPSYTVGNINGQDGWIKTGPYDVAVVSNTFGFGTFGLQSLRISNSITSGSFGDQTFSKPLLNEAGETDALNGGVSGGTRQPHFEAQFDLASTMTSLQPGLTLSVSPDRGDGARMSYLRFVDATSGIDVYFDDVQGTSNPANFVETLVANLNRATTHTIKFVMDFVDGPSNDIVKIFIDGNLVHTGTSWENYFRFDPESNPSLISNSRTVDSVLFREGGTATPANAGNGFLIDNLTLLSGPVPPPPTGSIEILKYACPDGTTVTRAANGVGLTVPPGCVVQSGATFGYVHGTQTDANGPFPELAGPFVSGGTTNASGILTIGSLPATGRYLVAETNSSSQQLAAGDILGLYCVGDGDTSGNNDNQELTFVSANATTHCIAYNKLPPAPISPSVHIFKYVDGVQATAVNANNAVFPMETTFTSPNLGSATNAPFTLSPTGWGPTDSPYEASFVGSDAGANYEADEVLGGPTVGASCDGTHLYALDGYSFGDTLVAAQQAATSTVAPSFTNLQSDKYVIVHNITCPTPAVLLKVHILKFLDGQEATASSANNYLFPMTATWNATNIGAGTGTYVLGTNFGGAAQLYGADTAAMSAPADYSTSEITDATSNVLPTNAVCVAGKFRLLGYKISTTSFTNAATSPTTTAVSFTGLSSDRYVLVLNETCPNLGSLTVRKTAVGGNATFSFTGDNGLAPFKIKTVAGVGSVTFNNLTPGTYHISELSKIGWAQLSNGCAEIVVNSGTTTLCTIANTKLGKIQGTKYEDKNGNGKLSYDEHHLSGWKIYLDSNGNDQFDPGEPATLTDKHGNYEFNNLISATYHVREVLKTGWIQTYPGTGEHVVNLAPGQTAKNRDFGNFKLGTISGQKFNDLNGNGYQNYNDNGLSGWVITLTKLNSSDPVQTTITNSSGKYSFTNLGPGTYRIREVQQPGWVQTTDNPSNEKITSGEVSRNNDFGNHSQVIAHWKNKK